MPTVFIHAHESHASTTLKKKIIPVLYILLQHFNNCGTEHRCEVFKVLTAVQLKDKRDVSKQLSRFICSDQVPITLFVGHSTVGDTTAPCPKFRTSVTHWFGVISQKNGDIELCRMINVIWLWVCGLVMMRNRYSLCCVCFMHVAILQYDRILQMGILQYNKVLKMGII